MYLEKEDFRGLVQHGVLFSIDLVVLDTQNRILVGERVNRPAQGYWFVPGGRVYKNETLAKAFGRICLNELGKAFNYQEAKPLGLYDHFYNDSVFGEDISTHYVNAPYLVELSEINTLNLPSEQHRHYRWVKVADFSDDNSIHQYSKVFLDGLRDLFFTSSHLAS
ncbi:MULTISPECIES: GDP-mannose mannosyl hydrolase [Marinomonas]|uniref:GDP-mannose mannosyl hydrolase n=1 Tax=Marinomonas arctica TaxID=383750 RepID=A0A7H1J463_9GAMM|nr:MULTISPECIES: GDP-mannose mannosyl hydrolase [Marinomonas]MCS7487743.1 GDP-mannose mannosyl hydrolase [Marinomonas sp. BSi20414]QNT05279.1 GDP-mannose mannosyl hydrolase [Marinomonas arctica]GGN38619.1 GDP-mannose mannosyl hydrolase WbdQ/WbhG [Marinomonas arctica]